MRHEEQQQGARNISVMKKILLMAAIVLSSLGVKAQTEPGTFTLMPKVGLNIAKSGFDDTKMKAGAVAGVEAEYRFSQLFGLSAGLLYSMQGDKADKGDGKFKTEYINIPILAHIYVWKGLSINAGIQPGFMTKAKEDYDDMSVDWKDACNTFDFSIPVGLSYELSNIVIDARYNIGVTDILKNNTVEFDEVDYDYGKNGVLSITVGYKFAL